MPSLSGRDLVYTCVFTPAGAAAGAAANPYVTLLCLWLHGLAARGAPDRAAAFDVLVLADAATGEHLGRSHAFGAAQAAAAAQGAAVAVAVVADAGTLHEGLFLRFAALRRPDVRAALEGRRAVAYLDVDVLAVRPLAPLLDAVAAAPEGVVHALPEGALGDANYSHTLLSPDEAVAAALTRRPGFSSGAFAFRPSRLVLDVLARVPDLRAATEAAYTHDQPAFNVTLARTAAVRSDGAALSLAVAVNRLTRPAALPPAVCLVNFMGEPGQGPVHVDKVLAMHLLLLG